MAWLAFCSSVYFVVSGGVQLLMNFVNEQAVEKKLRALAAVQPVPEVMQFIEFMPTLAGAREDGRSPGFPPRNRRKWKPAMFVWHLKDPHFEGKSKHQAFVFGFLS